MSHQVVSEEVAALIPKRKGERVRNTVTTIFKTRLPQFIDSLILLVIATLYFTFTGLAILFRSPLPKGWLSIAQSLTKGRLAKKVADLAEARDDTIKSKVSHRVIDLETRAPIHYDRDGETHVTTL